MMGVLMIFGILLTFLNSDSAFYINNELPCDFQDSINITNGIVQQDGSIEYQGTHYTVDQFAYVNYVFINGTKRETVKSHMRGCPCNVRPCIRLCCPLGSFVNTTNLKRGTILQQIPCYSHASAINYERDILDQHINQTNIHKLDELFSFAVLQSPVQFYKIKNFQITDSGRILYENLSITHRDYCLRADINVSSNQIEFGILAYFNDDDFEQLPTKYVLSAACMVVSVLFILATILVYILLPELHNLHGSCLGCHLAGLVVAYTLTAWVKFNGWHYVDSTVCAVRGHLMYFSLISAFLWSNVISYDLWRNFRATHVLRQCSNKKQFHFYMLYAWGISLLLTLVIVVLDNGQLFYNNFLPSIDLRTCFLRKESLLLFFYVPVLIIFTVNFAYFTLTSMKICQIQRDLIKMTSQEESARQQTNLNNGKDDLTLYVRLFVITGVTWIMEGLSFLISPQNNDWFFRFFDIWNALQGLIIFISYIMKRRVLVLLLKRYQEIFGKEVAKECISLNSSLNKSTNLRLSLSSCEKPKYKEFR